MENLFEGLLTTIKEGRSNEVHFEELLTLLQGEHSAAPADSGYRQQLGEVLEKDVTAYRQAKETGGTAWPEYERFVSHFEKAVLASR